MKILSFEKGRFSGKNSLKSCLSENLILKILSILFFRLDRKLMNETEAIPRFCIGVRESRQTCEISTQKTNEIEVNFHFKRARKFKNKLQFPGLPTYSLPFSIKSHHIECHKNCHVNKTNHGTICHAKHQSNTFLKYQYQSTLDA